MSIHIELNQRISTDEVLGWPSFDEDGIVFRVARSAEFEAGAEGAALSFLGAALRKRIAVNVECLFEFPAQKLDFLGCILSSNFGYALLRGCESAKFRDAAEKNLAVDLRRFAGQIYDAERGVVGSGDRAAMIAFDPKRPIPRVIQALTSIEQLPLPSQFSAALSFVLSGMGLKDVASQSTFPHLRDYIFEAFVNTLQHGRPKDQHVAKFSTRSISITKIAFNVAQLEQRRISTDLREFLQRIAEMEQSKKDLFVACISIMDMGDGIQNTLPPESAEESADRRLVRAFSLGATRKQEGPIERGLGLQNVLTSAFLLGARLQVQSSGFRLVKDFSLGEDRLPSMNGAKISELPAQFAAGTCVDLFVPKLLSNLDQRELSL
jgi:hypothetical protein